MPSISAPVSSVGPEPEVERPGDDVDGGDVVGSGVDRGGDDGGRDEGGRDGVADRLGEAAVLALPDSLSGVDRSDSLDTEASFDMPDRPEAAGSTGPPVDPAQPVATISAITSSPHPTGPRAPRARRTSLPLTISWTIPSRRISWPRWLQVCGANPEIKQNRSREPLATTNLCPQTSQAEHTARTHNPQEGHR